MIAFLFLISIVLSSNLNAKLENLEKFKQFLENGTYENQDFSQLPKMPKSRYYTFKRAFEEFIANKGETIVEVGTSRSFVHGGLIGCNSDDVRFWQPKNPAAWDWGAGFFTRMVAECLEDQAITFHTVDLISSHIKRCQIMTAEFNHFLQYHVASSVDFLRDFKGTIDLLYLDTGDMTPIEPTANLQLEEAEVVVQKNLIPIGGLILIDDVKNQTPKKFGETSDLGKSKYALPYLLKNGFEIIEDEYQVLLRRVR